MIFLSSLCIKAAVTPAPQHYTLVNDTYYYIDKLKYQCQSSGKDCLQQISPLIEFYNELAFPKGSPNYSNDTVSINMVHIELQTTQIPKSPLQGNETYQITTNTSGIYISAFDTFALARALATFCQLVVELPNDEYIPGKYVINSVYIMDFPIYKFRSVLYDTGKHHLTLQTMKRQLKAISISKMNVLHFHIIDIYANPFMPITPPADQFVNAAFNNGGSYNYSFEEMKELSKYASQLGIYIMVEVDIPGHATCWEKVNPKLVCNCTPVYWMGSTLHPLHDDVYRYIEVYIKDLIDAIYTPNNQDVIIHLGGDEVDHDCYKQDPELIKYMKDNGATTQDLWRLFHKKVNEIIDKLTNSTGLKVFWQESFENGNDFTRSIVHEWNDESLIKKALLQNIPVIRSQYWYLDVSPTTYLMQDGWQEYYKLNIDIGVDDAHKHLMLGGGTCVWGARIADGSVDKFAWPRSIAAGEVLWTKPTSREITDELKQRYQKLICKIYKAGVGVAPIIPSPPCPGTIEPIFD